MALPYVPLVARIALEGNNGTTPWANILHCLYDGGPPTTADLNTWCAAISSEWSAHTRAQQTSQAHLTSVVAVDLSSSTGAGGSWSGSIAGSDATGAAPANVAAVIKASIARRYRGGHPRTYFAGLPNSALADQAHLGATYMTSLLTAWNQLMTAITLPTYTSFDPQSMVCVSYRSGGAPRATPLVELITGFSVESQFGSQRRRIGR